MSHDILFKTLLNLSVNRSKPGKCSFFSRYCMECKSAYTGKLQSLDIQEEFASTILNESYVRRARLGANPINRNVNKRQEASLKS